MFLRTRKYTVVFVAILTSLLLTPDPAHANEDAGAELAARIEMVRTLLVESTAARRIALSTDATALEKHAQALAKFESAQSPGELETRKTLLNEAVALFYEASAAAPVSESADAKARVDFERRLDSVNSLLDAHKRIMEEKGTADTHASLLDNVETDIAAAESLLAAGNVDQARERLDLAYDVTRLAVENSRMGETLKRELKFDTPEDEYRYELDRNETHRMLLTVLLKDKLNNEYVRNKVDASVEAANKHRALADDLADQKRFDTAILELERSTAEIVKAIRGAGVYIPG